MNDNDFDGIQHWYEVAAREGYITRDEAKQFVRDRLGLVTEPEPKPAPFDYARIYVRAANGTMVEAFVPANGVLYKVTPLLYTLRMEKAS